MRAWRCLMATKNSGQHCLRQWLVARWHQVITRANADFSFMTSCGIHLRAISQQVPKLLFWIASLKIIFFKLLPHLPGANDLKCPLHLFRYVYIPSHSSNIMNIYEDMQIITKTSTFEYHEYVQSSAVITWSNSTGTEAEYQWYAGSTKDTPYLALTGELWGVFNWLRYNSTALYLVSLWRFHTELLLFLLASDTICFVISSADNWQSVWDDVKWASRSQRSNSTLFWQ